MSFYFRLAWNYYLIFLRELVWYLIRIYFYKIKLKCIERNYVRLMLLIEFYLINRRKVIGISRGKFLRIFFVENIFFGIGFRR